VLPFGRLWYDGPTAVANAIGYAEHRSRSHDVVIRVYDDDGNIIDDAPARWVISKIGSAERNTKPPSDALTVCLPRY
jgi:hypothetical protein